MQEWVLAQLTTLATLALPRSLAALAAQTLLENGFAQPVTLLCPSLKLTAQPVSPSAQQDRLSELEMFATHALLSA